MFRFKSGTFQFVLLFIYIQNKQKTHERKRTVLEIFPYHHYTGIRTYFIYSTQITINHSVSDYSIF